MPYGKGTYGSKRGRPPKNDKKPKRQAIKPAKKPNQARRGSR